MEAFWPPAAELRDLIIEVARDMDSNLLVEFRFRAGRLDGVMILRKGGGGGETPSPEHGGRDDPGACRPRAEKAWTCLHPDPEAPEGPSPAPAGGQGYGKACHAWSGCLPRPLPGGNMPAHGRGASERPRLGATGRPAGEAIHGSHATAEEPRARKRFLVLRSPEVGVWCGDPRGEHDEILEAGAVLGRVLTLAGDELVRVPRGGKAARRLAREGDPVGVGEPLILWEVME